MATMEQLRSKSTASRSKGCGVAEFIATLSPKDRKTATQALERDSKVSTTVIYEWFADELGFAYSHSLVESHRGGRCACRTAKKGAR